MPTTSFIEVNNTAAMTELRAIFSFLFSGANPFLHFNEGGEIKGYAKFYSVLRLTYQRSLIFQVP
jgi:hypothetical protein